MAYKYFECACTEPEHTIRFWYDEEDEWPEIFVSLYLQRHGFWKRLWNGIRYIFGRGCKWGDFTEVMLMPPAQEELVAFLQRRLEQMMPTESHEPFDSSKDKKSLPHS